MTGSGQPTASKGGRRISLPRLIYELTHPDERPPRVFKSVRQPRCIAPDHLVTEYPRRSTASLWQIIRANTVCDHSCLLWIGPLTTGGYARIQLDGAPRLGHRVVWSLVHGSISDHQVVGHSCSHLHCVNPDHLYLTSPSQRALDVTSLGARPHGEGHWNHQLTLDQVVRIRPVRCPAAISPNDSTCRSPPSIIFALTAGGRVIDFDFSQAFA